MPCRRVRTFSPAMFIAPMRKDFGLLPVPPFSFSMISQARGPWIWKRHRSRVTALPYGREGDRGGSRISTL